MKPWHWVLIVVACVGVLCCGGGSIFLLRSAGQGIQANRETKAFAEPVLVEFGKTWDFRKTFAKHGTEEAQRASTPEEYAKLQRLLMNRLGPLRSFGSWSKVFFGNDRGRAYVRLTGSGTAEKGPVTFEVTLVRRGDGWKLLGLRVNSPRLIADL